MVSLGYRTHVYIRVLQNGQLMNQDDYCNQYDHNYTDQHDHNYTDQHDHNYTDQHNYSTVLSCFLSE